MGVCGNFGHGASQCRALLTMLESSDRKKPHHRMGGPNDEKLAKEKLKAMPCSHCDKPGHTADYCWDLHPELMPAKFRKSESETEKKKEQPEVKAAVAKLGDGGGHTFTMQEMIEFAQEFAQRGVPTAEPTTPIKICGRQ